MKYFVLRKIMIIPIKNFMFAMINKGYIYRKIYLDEKIIQNNYFLI